MKSASNSFRNNEYYPYGLPMSSSGDYQGNDYKYGGKEFDMFQKVNIYDFAARTYVPDEARFWQPDPLAEICHGISPYVYCAADPVNNIDPDGRVWLTRTKYGIAEYYYDRQVQTTEDLRREYPDDPSVQIVEEGVFYFDIDGNTYVFYNDKVENKYGRVSVNGKLHNKYDIIYGRGFTIFGTADNSCNAKTLHQNLFGTSYTGPNNPRGYDDKDNYQYLPRNKSEYPSMWHDMAYDAAKAEGVGGALLDYRTPVIIADYLLAAGNICQLVKYPFNDPIDRLRSEAAACAFLVIATAKTGMSVADRGYQIYKSALNSLENTYNAFNNYISSFIYSQLPY